MTVIAWDGKTLAGDKRSTGTGAHCTVTKLSRLPDGSIFGVTGDFAMAQEKIAWLRSGAEPKDFPADERDEDKFTGILLVRPDGTVWKYENTPYPFQIERPFWAIGSGRDYALAAMHLGKNAVEAVELANLIDPSCGNGVDTLELK